MDHLEEIKEEFHQYGDDGDDSHDDGDDGRHQRPRLRLARACDRCKRRKIKCDTNSPCLPCITAKQLCTFNTPTRRSSKPRPVEKPRKNVKDLEARMAQLEQQLRQVPPHVHNAALTQLDASLLNPSTPANAVASSSSLVPPTTASSSSPALFVPLVPPVTAPALARPVGLNRSDTASSAGVESLQKEMEGMNLSPGFIYLDEMGMTKWQGATSGFPLLELLAEHERHPHHRSSSSSSHHTPAGDSPGSSTSSPAAAADLAPSRGRRSARQASAASAASASEPAAGTESPAEAHGKQEKGKEVEDDFFPGRKARVAQKLDPEASWKAITCVIAPDLMDTLIRSYLSTTHLLWPFLHVPSFLADYANPSRWGEPGFARFIVAVCTLSSRHVDDPRVRANPADPSSAGRSYLELFKKMQDLPSADRPTLYSMQASFLAAIYCMGLGTLSKAFMLFAESITMALDGGLHRDVGDYDIFNPIEREVRKRTFWSIYCWDKQSGACFGRPAMIHLRDCDVSEPVVLDDEYITAEGLGSQPETNKSRICAFVAAIRLHVVLEGVLDGSIRPSDFPSSPFLALAARTIAKRHPQSEALRDEEALLDEWLRLLDPHWTYSTETIASKDPIRITQAERLHCLENLVKMLIYRHRFSGFVLSSSPLTAEEQDRHLELCRTAMSCALAIVADHLHISQRGYMTYYGVHVIHQLAQAGRTLVAVILNCKSDESRPLIASSIEGFRSCVGLLRRFSGRYICGLRSADILEEFCRICRIPVDSPQVPDAAKVPSPAWLRPVGRKRHSPSPEPPARSLSPEDPPLFSPAPDAYAAASTPYTSASTPYASSSTPFSDPAETPASIINHSAQATTTAEVPPDFFPVQDDYAQTQASFGDEAYNPESEDQVFFNVFDMNAASSNPTPLPSSSSSSSARTPTSRSRAGSSAPPRQGIVPGGFGAYGDAMLDGGDSADGMILGRDGVWTNAPSGGGGGMEVDYADLGLPSAGMDGLMPGDGNENMSASEIFALLHAGEFDYSALFPDQQIADSSSSFNTMDQDDFAFSHTP